MKSAVTAAWLAAATSFGAVSFAAGKVATDIKIEPGPTVMSEQEKAIVADPAGGVQHGVILISETERDDNKGGGTEIAHHLRAKILSLEGRGLADIAIPIEHGGATLKTWWGRTILPDGTVLELPKESLESQAVAKSAAADYRELKGALPGIVPGCVVDYGYVLREDRFSESTRVFLQLEWPVLSFRYRWVPDKFMTSAYVTSRAEGLVIDAKTDAESVLIKAHDLSTVADEPLMPPLSEARGSVTFFYTTGEKPAEYWDLGAKRTESALNRFLGTGSAVRDAVAAIGIPPAAPLPDKLRAAYDWIGANVKNTFLKSAEEKEADDKSDDETYNAKTVLKAKEGSPRQLDFLFAGMARALGAEASIVYAVDRTEQFWNQSIKSFDQFSYTFVAVRAPGQPDGALVLVDPGSGLPYGQVPWRATGVSALMCAGKGRAIPVPPASPTFNRADTHVSLDFSDDNETMRAKWTRTAAGATGLETRRWLRDLDARRRKEKVDEICGASGRTEIVTAEIPGIDEAAAPFRITCDVEVSDMNVGDEIARYSLQVGGPWWPETADFPAAKRVHPVVFKYPKLDFLVIDVTAPHGFRPKQPPAPVRLDSQYGRYELSVTKTPTGYRVERVFALTVLIAKTPEYDALRKYFADVRRADQTALTFERDGSAE